MATKLYSTNYWTAVHWEQDFHRVLCNNIHEIDPSVYDNMRPYPVVGGKDIKCPKCGASYNSSDDESSWGSDQDGEGRYLFDHTCPECGHLFDDSDIEEEDEEQRDIYQWFLTNLNENDVEWYEKHFGLWFSYSDLLDCWILLVDHFGTPWCGVMIDTDLPNAARENGERRI